VLDPIACIRKLHPARVGSKASDEGRHIVSGAPEANDARIKGREILGQHIWRVSFGIDRYEVNSELVRIFTHHLKRTVDLSQGGRTDVRAVRIANVDEVGAVGDALPINDLSGLGDRLDVFDRIDAGCCTLWPKPHDQPSHQHDRSDCDS
jgi:hypothetical protein